MDPKKILSKEISYKIKGDIKEEVIYEKVEQFFRHGSTFLLLELISLRKEVESLRAELHQNEIKRQSSLQSLAVH
jgi:hypothetical protein